MTETMDDRRRLRTEERYQTLFEQSRDAIYITDVDGRIVDANPAMTELFGYDRGDLVGLDARELYLDPRDRERFREEIEPTGTVKDFEVRLQRKDGTSLACELTSTVYTDGAGEVIGYQGIIRDVSERRQLVSLLESTLEATADGILAVDRGGRVRYYNQRFLDMWDVSEEDVESGDRQRLLRHAHGLVEEGAGGMMDEGDGPGTRRYPREETWDTLEFDDGRVVQRHVRPRTLDGQVRGWVISFRDVTESKRLERELEEMAFHDSLTGLANRRLLRENAETALALADREDEEVGLVFADLARFKRINDNLGHPAGDEVLYHASERLRDALRDADVIARVGGDEFAVLLTRTDGREGALRAARRVRACFDQPFRVEDRSLHLDVRLGVALYPEHADDFDELFSRADQAMYQGRSGGRSSIAVYDADSEGTTATDLDRESELRRALERDELAVHLQPIFPAGGDEAAGYEALVRWHHPDEGVLSAGEFIPLAEESGLIDEMDRWMLEEVASVLSNWEREEGPPAWISVNVSARLLEDPAFPALVQELLKGYDLDPGRLMLEVTERTTMTRPGRVASILNRVHKLGVRIALDDFGTGHAVLANLKHFNFDVLKLDMLFIHRLDEDPRDEKLLEGITALGQELHMEVLAEGVESDRQLRFVEGIGADLVQGYLLGRPRDAGDLDSPRDDRPGG